MADRVERVCDECGTDIAYVPGNLSLSLCATPLCEGKMVPVQVVGGQTADPEYRPSRRDFYEQRERELEEERAVQEDALRRVAAGDARVSHAPRSPHQDVMLDFPTEDDARKGIPVMTGLLDYFPAACSEVARVSKAGNGQHNPGQPLHWARGKSTDHADCLVRHMMQRGTLDSDGIRHTAKVAWRALALLQEELEREAGFTPEVA
jgi:hypothetical protein